MQMKSLWNEIQYETSDNVLLDLMSSNKIRLSEVYEIEENLQLSILYEAAKG